MSEQIPLTRESRADDPEIDRDNDDSTHEIADDLAYSDSRSSTWFSLVSPVRAIAMGFDRCRSSRFLSAIKHASGARFS